MNEIKESKIDIVAYTIATLIISLFTAIAFIVEQPIIAMTMLVLWGLIILLGLHFLSYLPLIQDDSIFFLVPMLLFWLVYAGMMLVPSIEKGVIILFVSLPIFMTVCAIVKKAADCLLACEFSHRRWQEVPIEIVLQKLKRRLRKVGLAE